MLGHTRWPQWACIAGSEAKAGGGIGKVVQVACQMPDDSVAIAVRMSTSPYHSLGLDDKVDLMISAS